MDWKDILAILMACALATVGVITGRCSNELVILCSAIVGGVFGRASAGVGSRVVHVAGQKQDQVTVEPSK